MGAFKAKKYLIHAVTTLERLGDLKSHFRNRINTMPMQTHIFLLLDYTSLPTVGSMVGALLTGGIAKEDKGKSSQFNRAARMPALRYTICSQTRRSD